MPQSSFPEKAIKEFGKQVPLKRPGQPVEVAAAFGASLLLFACFTCATSLTLRP